MPIIKSAKKRVRVAHKATVRNSKTKRGLRSALKAFLRKPASASHHVAQSAVDKAAKKGVIHKNKASRLKKQLAVKSKASEAHAPKVAPKKTTRKVSTAKKSPVKKQPKKTSAKTSKK